VQRILLERPGSTRVHTLGVGSSVNRTLTEWVARAGGGLEQIIEPRAEATEAVTHLMARTAAPLVVDVRVSGSALVDGAPFRTPDLFAGSPATLHLRTVPEGGTLHVKGMGAHGEWCVEIAVPPAPSEEADRSVAACWARQRVDDLELSRLSQQNVPAIDAAITELGVDYQISTRLTSWVAVSKRSTVDGLAPKRTVTQPQEVPANVSIENFGLRGALQEAPSGYGGAVDKRLGTRGAAPARARSQRVTEQIQQAEQSWAEDDAEEGLSVRTLGEATRSRGLPPERKAKKRGPAGPPRPAPKSMPAPVQETVEANATDGASPGRPPLYVPQGTPSEEDGLMGGNPMMLPMLLVALLTSPVWLPIAGVVWLVRALLNWVRRDG
jgi:Ca-activated chloride channel family protein